jgi:TRAP-type C4-dicarboxylate transport system substrate-binding protein
MSVKNMKFYESLKYATNPSNAYLAEPRPVVVSKKWWGSLSGDVKSSIQSSLKEAAAFQRELFLSKQTQAVEDMKKKGMIITDIDVNAFMKKIQPVWHSYAKEVDKRGNSGMAAQDLVKAIIASRPN